MKTREVEKTVKVKEYIAYDGLLFDNLEECRKYEKEAVERATKYIEASCLKKFDGDEVSILHAFGSGDGNEYILRLDEAIQAQLVTLISICYCYTGSSEWQGLYDRIEKDTDGKEVVWVEEYGGDWFYYGTLADCLLEANNVLIDIFN